MISNTITKRIIDETNIAEVVAEYIPLQKKGNSFKCICPFHQDTNPSMSISVERKVFNCFSCGTKGNVIYFVSRYENITIDQATIKLAKRIGIEIDEKISRETEKEEKLLKVMEIAADFYSFYLQNTIDGKVALEYLKNRGIGLEIITKYRIGLSPKEKDYLHQALNAKQISVIDQIELGLVTSNADNNYDVFRNRIMFPICNHNNKVVGFSGRIYDNSNQSKYVNSYENAIFHKGEILYNFANANQTVRLVDKIYLFEGFMDVIAADQSGIINSVATMGTALTKEHIRAILSLTKNIILCFDGDAAGITAMKKAAQLLTPMNIIPQAVILPDGLDPDDYSRKFGPQKLKYYLENHARDVYQTLYDLAFANIKLDDIISSEKFKKEVFDFIKLTNQETIINHFIQKLSLDLNISYEILSEDFRKNTRKKSNDYGIMNEELPISSTTAPKVIHKRRGFSHSKVNRSYSVIIRNSLHDKDNFWEFIDKTSSSKNIEYPGINFDDYYLILNQIKGFYLEHPEFDGINESDLALIFTDQRLYDIVMKIWYDKIPVGKSDRANARTNFIDCIDCINAYFKDEIASLLYDGMVNQNDDDKIHEFVMINRENKKIK